MEGAWLVSYVALWGLVVSLAWVLFVVVRQLGIAYLGTSEGISRDGLAPGSRAPDFEATELGYSAFYVVLGAVFFLGNPLIAVPAGAAYGLLRATPVVYHSIMARLTESSGAVNPGMGLASGHAWHLVHGPILACLGAMLIPGIWGG